jgi:hydroxymethylglutaryl-CoA reductase (NADPH)
MIIPSMLLKKLYTLGSLKNSEAGVQFAVKNRLSDVELIGLRKVAIDGKEVPLRDVKLVLMDGRTLAPSQISAANPLAFPLRTPLVV